MARLIPIDDSEWIEVVALNNYALLMGYLLMGVRGLGLLVLTWTTVVLLGGFVSNLSKEDFWSLTIITLIETAGVFDFLLKEKARDILKSLMGMLAAIFATVLRPFKEDKGTSVLKPKEPEDPSVARILLAIVLMVVQLLVLAIVLCPVAILYLLGLYISTGISLWRLIQHDYGNAGGSANLRPALNVLYSLAVAQGIFFGYKTMYDYMARSRLAKAVASEYPLDVALVSDYLDETLTGCMKDVSFARGRNFITYAVELLMEYKLSHGSILRTEDYWHAGRSALVKQLLPASASFGHVIWRLLETMGPRSPYSAEIREHAANIVAQVAGSIRLEQLPVGTTMECVFSLLGTLEEHGWQPEGYTRNKSLPMEYERDWLLAGSERNYLISAGPRAGAGGGESPPGSDSWLRGYKELVVQGLRILQELAVDEGNCRVMSSTQGLVSKAMGPLLSDQLRRDHEDEWCGMAEEALKLISRLMAAPGETGTELRRQMSSHREAIVSAVERILIIPDQSGRELQELAVEILLDLSVDTSSIVATAKPTAFISALVKLFLGARATAGYYRSASIHWIKKRSYIRNLAGQELLAITSHGRSNATVVLESVSDADLLGELATTIVDAENNAYRLLAAQILEHICLHYTKDNGYLNKLKDATARVMPKTEIPLILQVLGEILTYGSTAPDIQAGKDANKATYSAPDADVEKGRASQDKGQKDASSSHQKNRELHGDIKLQEALVSLCVTICNKWIKADPNLARQFDEIAAKVCSEQGWKKLRSVQNKWIKTLFTSLVEEARTGASEK